MLREREPDTTRAQGKGPEAPSPYTLNPQSLNLNPYKRHTPRVLIPGPGIRGLTFRANVRLEVGWEVGRGSETEKPQTLSPF